MLLMGQVRSLLSLCKKIHLSLKFIKSTILDKFPQNLDVVAQNIQIILNLQELRQD